MSSTLLQEDTAQAKAATPTIPTCSMELEQTPAEYFRKSLNNGWSRKHKKGNVEIVQKWNPTMSKQPDEDGHWKIRGKLRSKFRVKLGTSKWWTAADLTDNAYIVFEDDTLTVTMQDAKVTKNIPFKAVAQGKLSHLGNHSFDFMAGSKYLQGIDSDIARKGKLTVIADDLDAQINTYVKCDDSLVGAESLRFGHTWKSHFEMDAILGGDGLWDVSWLDKLNGDEGSAEIDNKTSFHGNVSARFGDEEGEDDSEPAELTSDLLVVRDYFMSPRPQHNLATLFSGKIAVTGINFKVQDVSALWDVLLDAVP